MQSAEERKSPSQTRCLLCCSLASRVRNQHISFLLPVLLKAFQGQEEEAPFCFRKMSCLSAILLAEHLVQLLLPMQQCVLMQIIVSYLTPSTC